MTEPTSKTARLTRQGIVLGDVKVADSFRARTKGLLGAATPATALLLVPAKGVHTFGMSFAIDVAYLRRRTGAPDGAGCYTASSAGCYTVLYYTVLATKAMRPWRMGRPRFRSNAVLEAGAGAFERWNLQAGDEVQIVP